MAGVSTAVNVALLGGSFLLMKKMADVLGLTKSKQERVTQDYINKVKVNPANLRSDPTVYNAIANAQYTELYNHTLFWNTYNFSKMYNALASLNPDELRQVYKDFGMRKAKLFNTINIGDAGDLLEWYSVILTSDENKQMENLWAKSGLVPDKYSPYGNPRNPNKAVSNLWKEIDMGSTYLVVYPRYVNYSMLGWVRDANGNPTPYRTVHLKSYKALGTVLMKWGNKSTNKAVWVKVRITNAQVLADNPHVKGIDLWYRTTDLNTTPPPTGVSGIEPAPLPVSNLNVY